MLFFAFLINLKVIALGAVYGRLDGGGIATTSEWVERSLVMFFFVLACAPFAGIYALIAYLGVLGIATGHGQYFPDSVEKYTDPQGVDPLVRLFFGKDPRTKHQANYRLAMLDYGMTKLYWRNAFGMFVTGSLVGIPAFVLSTAFGQPAGFLFLATGLVKSLAYMVGDKVWKNTESAEYINGGLRNLICLIVISLVVSWTI